MLQRCPVVPENYLYFFEARHRCMATNPTFTAWYLRLTIKLSTFFTFGTAGAVPSEAPLTFPNAGAD